MDTCTHHWIIEPHLIGTSQSKCKLCGESKELNNVPLPKMYIAPKDLRAAEKYRRDEKESYITAK